MTVDTPLCHCREHHAAPETTSPRPSQVVGRAVSTRTSVQILAGILLRAEDERCRPLGDGHGDVAAGCPFPATGRGDGFDRRSRPAPRRHRAAAAARRRSSLDHEENDGVVRPHVRARRRTACTPTAPRTSPVFPRSRAPSSCPFQREAFLETIAKVSRAASRDESRPVLTGILVQLEGAKLVMAATDSYRLSVKETTLDARHGTAARGDRAGPCARRARPDRPGAARPSTSASASRRTRSCVERRRHLADRAADRRPVPELPSAAAGVVRGRGRRRPGGAARRRPRVSA